MLSRYFWVVGLYDLGKLEQNMKVARSLESLLWPFDVILELLDLW